MKNGVMKDIQKRGKRSTNTKTRRKRRNTRSGDTERIQKVVDRKSAASYENWPSGIEMQTMKLQISLCFTRKL